MLVEYTKIVIERIVSVVQWFNNMTSFRNCGGDNSEN